MIFQLAAELVMKARTCNLLEGDEGQPVASVKALPSTSTPIKPPHSFPHHTHTIERSDLKDSQLLGSALDLNESKGPHTVLTDIYTQMYDYFGDALAIKLPINHVKDFYLTRKEEVFVSLADEDAKKTGEELLQNFLNVSHMDDNDAKSENHSYDYDNDEKSERSERSSRSERSHSDESLGFLDESTDLTVKAMSDPSQGIKLTIFKRPRVSVSDSETKVSPDKSNTDDKPAKRRRLNLRAIKDSDIFDRVPIQQKKPVFVFNYAGAIQSCEPKQKEWTWPSPVIEPLFTESELVRLSNTLKPYGKRKGSKHGIYQSVLHAYSSNITCFL